MMKLEGKYQDIEFDRDSDGDVYVEIIPHGKGEITAFYVFKKDVARLIAYLQGEPSGDNER